MRTLVLAATAAAALTAAPIPAVVTDNDPMRIAILVDTGAGTRNELPQLRRGLAALITAIPEDQEIALISTGRNIQTRVPPSVDRKKLLNAVNNLIPGDGPTPLMDALVEVDERFMRPVGKRPTLFVVITGDGTESSKVVDGEIFNRWLSTLQQRDIVAHAIVLKRGNGVPEVVASVISRATRGHFETVGTGAQMAVRMQSLGEQIAASVATQRK